MECEERLRREQEEREERREEERERSQERLLTTLKVAVPQKVNIHKVYLPHMKEGDDSVVFIIYLETALKFKKLFQEAETEAEYIEKVTIATMRSMLNKELRQYLDPMDITTLQRYLIKINQWVQCRAEEKPIYQLEVSQRGDQKDSREHSLRKKVTWYHCGKLVHMSKECRTRLCS